MDFTVNGIAYKSSKLPLIQQFHISRKLAPVVWAGNEFLSIHAFANMNANDAQFIFNACLAVTQRQQGQLWANVGTLEAMMFDQMRLQDTYEIVMEVIRDSLGNFFPEMFSKVAAAATKASPSQDSQAAKIGL